MAYASVLASTSQLTSSRVTFSKTHPKTPSKQAHFPNTQNPKPLFKRSSNGSSKFPQSVAVSDVSPDGLFDISEIESEIAPSLRPVKFAFWVLVWASLSLAWFAASGDAKAASDSIKASSFGLKVASALRSSGWPDEAVVFALATLPVIELRGAIPVGYWMQLKPVVLTVLAILGNMVPVPFIILYLKKLATFLTGKNQSASRVLGMLFREGQSKSWPRGRVPMARSHALCGGSFSWNRSVDRCHHSLYSRHAVLACILCKFLRGRAGRPFGQLAGQSRPQIRCCYWYHPVFCFDVHVEHPPKCKEVHGLVKLISGESSHCSVIKLQIGNDSEVIFKNCLFQVKAQ